MSSPLGPENAQRAHLPQKMDRSKVACPGLACPELVEEVEAEIPPGRGGALGIFNLCFDKIPLIIYNYVKGNVCGLARFSFRDIAFW
jgi:hypothetical protein